MAAFHFYLSDIIMKWVVLPFTKFELIQFEELS